MCYRILILYLAETSAQSTIARVKSWIVNSKCLQRLPLADPDLRVWGVRMQTFGYGGNLMFSSVSRVFLRWMGAKIYCQTGYGVKAEFPPTLWIRRWHLQSEVAWINLFAGVYSKQNRLTWGDGVMVQSQAGRQTVKRLRWMLYKVEWRGRYIK